MKTQSKQLSKIEPISQAGFEAAQLMLDAMGNFMQTVTNASPMINTTSNGSCCEVPPACWMPKHFGEIQSQACPCGTALLRVRITNCQREPATIRTVVRGGEDLKLKITPDTVVLGPMERKWVTIAVTVPDDACIGQEFELLVWVVGCNEHYARWTVAVTKGASGTCSEVELEDCPDYEHHWYDHFYCVRPCFAPRRGGQDGR